nr:glycosyltransferase [uncultured Sphaerochaeta sp.]
MRKILVSIICTAYNHEKYIASTLNGFIIQKTTFDFEILVHDDCSSDCTAAIISEYKNKYPRLIKVFYEKENQYSKHVPITRSILVPNAQGKYLAFCEGDDFWIDEYKLQKQVDILENNSDVIMCCHAHNRINASTQRIIDVMTSLKNENGYIDYEDLLSVSNFPHYSSMMVKKDDYASMPLLYQNLPIGDYPLRAFCLATGKVYYIKDVMSNYRVMSDSSWSKRERFNFDYRYEMNKKMNEFMINYDKETNFKYHEFLYRIIEKKDYQSCVFCGRFIEAKSLEYYKKANIPEKLVVNLGMIFPRFTTWLIMLRSILIHVKG